MPNEYCNICLKNSRPVKFISDRIHICQWCVTLLNDTPIDPQEIEDHLMSIIKKQTWNPPEKPDQSEIYKKAQSYVKSQESFFESIITSVINKNKREIKTQELFNEMLQQANTEHESEIIRYGDDFTQKIQSKYNKLLSGEYMPKELTSFFAKRDIFSSRWSSPVRLAWKDSLDSVDKKFIKYIRAYKHNLLSGIKKQYRPEEQFMKILRSDIKKQDSYQCKICSKLGKDVELHVHHIIPIDKFGSNHPNNLITLCHSCHNKQHPGFQVTRTLPIKRKRTGGEFISVDIETTGLSQYENHIIELAAVKFKSAKVVDIFSTLVNPKVPIPANITKHTGIDDHMVLNAPTIHEIFHEFIRFIGNEKLVFHNAAFDMRFLRKTANDFGYTIDNDVVDTLQLSRKKLPHLQNHKLQTLVWHFNIKTDGKHRALADSYATGHVYIECLRTGEITDFQV